MLYFFFFNDTATTEIYTLSLHDALPISRGMGLGGSAAIAVAIIRGLSNHFNLGLSDEEVNGMAFESEKIAHGNPSGIDNTMATFGQPLIYRTGEPPLVERLNINESFSLVVGFSRHEGVTAKTRSEEHTSELQSRRNLVCRLLLEKKKQQKTTK